MKVIATKSYDGNSFELINYKHIRIVTEKRIIKNKSIKFFSSIDLPNNIIDSTSFALVRKYINYQFKTISNPLTCINKESLKLYK